MNKAVKILLIVFGVLALLVMFVGFYLMMQTIITNGDNHTTIFMWMGVLLGGTLLLGAVVTIYFVLRKKNAK